MTSRQDEIDGRPRDFGITTQELQGLMENRGHEGYQMIQSQYGGVTELCKKLYTSPNEGNNPLLSSSPYALSSIIDQKGMVHITLGCNELQKIVENIL